MIWTSLFENKNSGYAGSYFCLLITVLCGEPMEPSD